MANMRMVPWLESQKGIFAGLTIEFFAGRGQINKNTAEVQIELVQSAIDSLIPGYEMKSLAWLPTGKKKGIVGPFDRVGWNWQRKGISRGQYRKHAAVAWRGTDQQDFFLIATERTDAADSIRISTSLRYANELCQDEEQVEKLVQIARNAWAHLKIRYGYGSLGVTDEGAQQPSAQRAIDDWGDQSKITLANVTPELNEQIARDFAKKVKGAYWLNLLSDAHVKAVGGIEKIDETLPEDIRIEEFKNGGVLIQLAPTPDVENSMDNQGKFVYLSKLLAPIVAQP
ncbi:MAG: DUF3396 domain-containing protein [Actinobacteria bacterium]|nr:MAG: DUF3396 domain-containing protein [Actinomycetota bacterium]